MTKKIVTIALPFLVVLISCFIYRKLPLELLVNKKINPDYRITRYNDHQKGGESEIKLMSSGQGIFYQFKLSPKIQFPSAGLSFFCRENDFIDLSGYDNVRIKISSDSNSRIALIIWTNIEGHRKINDSDLFLNNQFVLNPTSEPTIIDIPLSGFKSPDWWFTEHKILKKHYHR